MKVSLNWIREFTKVDLPIDELVEKIGAQLGAVEGVVDIGKKYQGIVVARVVSCEKHPNADKLQVCKIDDGGKAQNVERDEKGLVQVVCGAPNVREGLTVAWLPPGTTVPESVGKDPFVLEAREIRGQKSNGMLASPRELAIGDNHEGILELDGDAKPGDDFAKLYELDDYIIDIENKMFTHRPDCFGMIGVAREIAGIQHQKFTSPAWYKIPTIPQKPDFQDQVLEIGVKNELPELVPRFTAIAMSNIKVGPSPVWMQIELSKVGLKLINNIVDYTNYYMLLTGQPLHAYDADKLRQVEGSKEQVARLEIRKSRKGDSLKLLNGKEVTFTNNNTILITSGDVPVGIGGVMGGSETEVDENTKNIILECATFDMYSIRRTSMEHGLFTDAVTRFTKGQSPLQNLAVLAKVVDEIRKNGGKVASNAVDDSDVKDREWVHPPVKVSAEFINARLGVKLSADETKGLLGNVEFKVDVSDEDLTVTAPFWRTDIEIPEDVVEEVGRLYGFDKLPLELPRRSIAPAKKDELLELKSKIRAQLAKAGANEVLTYSFVHGDLLDKVGQDKSQAFQIANALSPNLQYYRLSLTPSLLDKVRANIKAGFDEFAIFELGKAHGKDEVDNDGLPKEFERLSLIFAAEPKAAKQKYTGAAYYQARKFAQSLFVDRKTFKLIPLKDADLAGHELTQRMAAPYEPNRSAAIHDGERVVGAIGEYKRSVAKALKLPDFCAGFEIFLSAVTAAQKSYVPLPRFPKVTQDITLKVVANLPYMDLFSLMQQELDKAKPEDTLSTLSPIGIYQKEDDETHKNVTLRLAIASYEKTMTDAEVATLLDEVASAAKEKLGAERI